MKPKLNLLTIVGLAAFTSAAIAQTNAPGGDAAPPPASLTATNEAAPGGNAAPPPASLTATNEAAPAAPAVTPSAAASAPAEPAAPEPGAVIPLIVMDDVPLTDAIRNLARQARLNYMLDPKIGFGQPGPDGKIVPQPTVSIRWENITAEQALAALLNNYSLQMVEDPKSKIARIAIKDPAAPEPLVTKVIQLKYASPTNVLASVQSVLQDKRSKVVPDVRTSQLVVSATDKEVVAVDQLVERLDTQTKQVLIEAKLVETSISPGTVKGIDWTGTLQAQHFAFGNNLQTKPVPADSVNPPLASAAGIPKLLADTAKGFNPATAFLDADGVSAVLSFLNTYGEAKVLSTPRTVTLDNEPARIDVFTASPIINVTASTPNTTGGSQITYTNLGVLLNVTPRISANDYVNLKVVPEVSRKNPKPVKQDLGTLGTFSIDQYDIRRIETRVMIPSGNTLVLGGLVQDAIDLNSTKVPLLGDIPYLGYLFRSDSKQRQKSNLLVFITPSIVQDSDYQPAQTDFLKTKPIESLEPDWSSWDSGKAKDWSKKSDETSPSGAGQFAPTP